MTPKVTVEIQQVAPPRSPEHEAWLNLVRTAAVLNAHLDALVERHGVTIAQYNVLRILRGAGPRGLCRNEIRERMITRMPDTTRLLDRMEAAGFVRREPDADDRRMVRTVITPKARRVLETLDEPVHREHLRRFGFLSRADLSQFISTLERIRDEA